MNNRVLKLHILKRQFGEGFVETAIQSATFLHALGEIRINRVKIHLVDGPCRAYYHHKKRTIFIGRWCPRNYKIISLVHEFVHAIVKPTTEPEPGVTGRQEFIDRCLDEETEAIMTELQCVDELVKAGINLNPAYLERLKLYRKGGRLAIRKQLKTLVTSTTDEDYPTYYGAWYDEKVPSHLRLP